MKSVFVIFIGLALIGSASLMPTAAQASPAFDEAPFVDLDGDGFDDNIDDADNDGIPDIDPKVEPAPVASSSPRGGFSFDATEVTHDLPVLSLSQRFGKLKHTVRGIYCARGGFDAGDDFGNSDGIGIGSAGKVCINGVCF